MPAEAAEVFSFEDGLKLVKKRGELMGTISGGGMAAVLGLSVEEIKDILKENQLETIDVANPKYTRPNRTFRIKKDRYRVSNTNF